MRGALVAVATLAVTLDTAKCQVDTSSYQRSDPAPSFLDTMGKVQELELQRLQIERQRFEIERQKWEIQRMQRPFPLLQGDELQRQLKFEREQAELYRKRQIERATKAVQSPQSN
jgi:hypothetical protein